MLVLYLFLAQAQALKFMWRNNMGTKATTFKLMGSTQTDAVAAPKEKGAIATVYELLFGGYLGDTPVVPKKDPVIHADPNAPVGAGLGLDQGSHPVGSINLVTDKSPKASIEQLQTSLVSLGYDLGTFGAKKDGVDGGYGASTKDAVSSFQKTFGLPVTGEADPTTRAVMLGKTGVDIGQAQDPRGESNANTRGQGRTSGDYKDLYSQRGAGYNKEDVVSYSHYNRKPTAGGLSARHGDAPPEVQQASIDLIIEEGRKKGMTNEQVAYTLAIAKTESGFNPDAAAGTTSAQGLGQFIKDTGESFGLNKQNMWEPREQARALVEHTLGNYALAKSKGLGEDYVYALHHDGPSLKSGGLAISRERIRPDVAKFLEILESNK